MKAIDLKKGDRVGHRSLVKIPSVLVVGTVEITRRKVVVTPEPPWDDYKLTFLHEQNVKVEEKE